MAQPSANAHVFRLVSARPDTKIAPRGLYDPPKLTADQWTAHALGIRHFGVQYDETFTSPNIPEVAYPEGFQGEHIEVVGKVVADLIEDRLAGKAA